MDKMIFGIIIIIVGLLTIFLYHYFSPTKNLLSVAPNNLVSNNNIASYYYSFILGSSDYKIWGATGSFDDLTYTKLLSPVNIPNRNISKTTNLNGSMIKAISVVNMGNNVLSLDGLSIFSTKQDGVVNATPITMYYVKNLDQNNVVKYAGNPINMNPNDLIMIINITDFYIDRLIISFINMVGTTDMIFMVLLKANGVDYMHYIVSHINRGILTIDTSN